MTTNPYPEVREMGLFATTCDIQKVRDNFPTADLIRSLLADNGFIPLVKIEDGEHWVRKGRRVILLYEGDIPGSVEPKDLMYATLVWSGAGWTISLD